MERVRAVREGFFKLPINAQAFERRSLTAELLGEVDLGDRIGAQRTQLIDQQVGIGCVRPAGAPVIEPFEQDLMGELVDGAGAAGDEVWEAIDSIVSRRESREVVAAVTEMVPPPNADGGRVRRERRGPPGCPRR
ncbi:hypothetical protein [Nonomuraea sp. NPDC049480]|uniref:hypothetical protein n=1 Tax=Nonomuraea sp. NPDC049480 TaxID=3364353 RepID=UPI0037B1AD06